MIRVLHDTNIDFMGKRKIAYAFSTILILAGLISLITKGGPRTGVDFAGGTLLEVRTSQKVAVEDLRNAAAQAGFGEPEIQTYEGSNDALFRLGKALVTEKDTTGRLKSGPAMRLQEALQGRHPGLAVEVLRQEVVGPKVGSELRYKAFLAVIVSVIAIMIYVALRFHRWEFGAGGAIALFHDIMVTLGIFSLLNKEIGLTVLAAFLTIAGYSINDTIVVFDRVRENLGKNRKQPLDELMNHSINQTLSRTVLTVLTVMLAAASLYFLGGKVIHDFALCMLIGVGFGTYSSVFVASALSLDIDNWRQRKIKEKALATAAASKAVSGKKAARAAAAGSR